MGRIDDNNCFSIDSFLINEPDSMFLIAQHPVASCTGSNNAQIYLSVYGGIQNTSGLTYSYMWNNWNITSVNSNLSAGTYSVIVNDANNCELRDTFEIIPYTVDIVALVTNIDCFGKQPTKESIRAEKASKYKELKKNTKEYEEWFLNYNPANIDRLKLEKKEQKEKTKTKKEEEKQKLCNVR